MTEQKLIEEASAAKNGAYVPYSHFRVGAALITSDGRVYTGCNIENSSFGATNCAERTAVFKAVSEQGKIRIKKIAIVSDSEDYVYPCGICRQVLAEFADDDMEIICTKSDGSYKVITLGDMLPNAFRSF
jgi:cytidine deaminase